ncbi:MAG: (d)CMP kinase [bacterium]
MSPGEDSPERRPVVTIDGPAGSGKSSTAAEVARRLGLRHLDSGALYRALTLALLRSDVPEEDWDDEGLRYLGERRLELQPGAGSFRVTLDGEDPGEALRSPEVNERVSTLAALPQVRALVLGPLRAAARQGGVVADGRDMGTVVLPDADLKVYLTASLRERARRRLLQEGREASDEAVDRTAGELEERDLRDRTRAVAPLRRPEGALEVDTTVLTFSQQVDRIVEAVRALRHGPARPPDDGTDRGVPENTE